MIIEEVKDFNEFLNLEEDWNRLLRKSSFDTVFSRHEWYRCWWEAYGGGNELSILLCKEEGRLIAISPLMMSKDHFRGFPIKKISFIENDETPHCTILVDREADLSAIQEGIFNYLTSTPSRWDILWLRKIPKDTGIIDYIKKYLEENEYKFIIRTSLQSPVLIIETDWGTFYSGRTQRFKKKVRHDYNKLKKQGDIEIQKLDTPSKIDSHLKDVFRIGCQSWKGKIRKSIGSTPENRIFFSTLPRALTNDRNGILLWTLRIKGEMIAFEYHVKEKNTMYALRGEFDEAYRPYGPGAVLDYEIVRNLFDNNVKIYDMCGSPDDYKLRWTSELRSHLEFLIFSRRPYSKFLALLEKNAKPIAKRILQLGRFTQSASNPAS